MFHLTITYRGGSTETRTYLEKPGALSGFEFQKGNALVRDAVLTGPNGALIATYHL